MSHTFGIPEKHARGSSSSTARVQKGAAQAFARRVHPEHETAPEEEDEQEFLGGIRYDAKAELEEMQRPWDGKWWRLYGRLAGWSTVKAAYTTECTTVGVLSALLLTISFPLVISPPALPTVDPLSNATQFYDPVITRRLLTYGASVACLASSVSVVLSSLAIVTMNVCISDGMIHEFFADNEWIAPMNGLSFSTSIVALVGVAMCGMFLQFDPVDATVCGVVVGVTCVAMGVIYNKIYFFGSIRRLATAHELHAQNLKKRLQQQGMDSGAGGGYTPEGIDNGPLSP